ncbi:MAG: hypothetical protein ACE5NG_00650, partial [bacterium]
NPEEYAGISGTEVQTKLIPSDSTWLVSRDFYPGWTKVDFGDSLWMAAREIGPGAKFFESEAKKIWVHMDQGSIPSTDSTQSGLSGNKFYVRKTFEIPGLPVSGLIQLNLDGSYYLFLNSQLVTSYNYGSSQEPATHTYNLSESLQSGKNVLAIEVRISNNLVGSLEAVLEINNLPEWFNIQEQLKGSFENNLNDRSEERVKVDEQ